MNTFHHNLWLWHCLKSSGRWKLSASQKSKPQCEIVFLVRGAFLLLNWNISFYNLPNNWPNSQLCKLYEKTNLFAWPSTCSHVHAYMRTHTHRHTPSNSHTHIFVIGLLWNSIYCKSCTSRLISWRSDRLFFCIVENAHPGSSPAPSEFSGTKCDAGSFIWISASLLLWPVSGASWAAVSTANL